MQSTLLAEGAWQSKPVAHLNWYWGLNVYVNCIQFYHLYPWCIVPSNFYRLKRILAWPSGSDFASGSFSWVSSCLRRGRELKHAAIIPWQCHLMSLVILRCLYFMSKEGKGRTFLLHWVNVMDSTVWSFL